MMAQLQNLISALRDELEQYGEMLALLDQQHEAGRPPGAEAILQSASALHTQSAAILAARHHRQQGLEELAQALGLPSQATFGHLVPMLPGPYRPLVSALVQENNDLLGRIQERARQSQLWLQRSAEVMQQFITRLTLPPSPVEVAEEATEPLTEPASPRLYEAIA